jgi:hypothetical protein
MGIAMGTGTDVAMESAGVTLVKGDLRGIAKARRLSRATMRNIRQNLFFAFFYNALGVPLAAGMLYPVFACNESLRTAGPVRVTDDICWQLFTLSEEALGLCPESQGRLNRRSGLGFPRVLMDRRPRSSLRGIRDFETWLDSSGKSPAEVALKNRLRDILRR